MNLCAQRGIAAFVSRCITTRVGTCLTGVLPPKRCSLHMPCNFLAQVNAACKGKRSSKSLQPLQSNRQSSSVAGCAKRRCHLQLRSMQD